MNLWLTVSGLLLGLGLGYVRDEPAPLDWLMIPLTLGTLLYHFFAPHRKPILLPATLLALFFVLHLPAFLYGSIQDFGRAIRYGSITGYLASFWYIGRILGDRESFRQGLLAGIFLALVANLLAGLLEYFGFLHFDPSTWRFGERLQGFYKDPNVLGPFAIFAGCVAAFVFRRPRHILLRNVALGVATLTVILTFSRGAWVNLAVTLSASLILLWRRTRSITFLASTAITLLGVVWLMLLWNPSWLEFAKGRLGMMAYDEARFYFQIEGLRTGWATFWGIGPGQSERVLEYATHSLFVRVWAEQGPLGMLALSAFLLLHVYALLQALRRAQTAQDILARSALLACLLGTLANSFFIDTLHWRHFWLLLGLTWAYAYSLPDYEGRAWRRTSSRARPVAKLPSEGGAAPLHR
jgi:hypothetical protein